MKFKAESDLLLHQILQMCDPLCVLWMTADVVLIKEGLLHQSHKMMNSRINKSIQKPNPINPKIHVFVFTS